MKQCINCRNMVDDSTKHCPYCGTPLKNPQDKNKKTLLIVLFSLIGVAVALGIVFTILMLSRCSKAEARTFDLDCAQYTEEMNRLLGSKKLDQNKWKAHSDNDGFTYTDDSFEIDLGTDRGNKKVNSITVGPSDKEEGINMAAASMMVVEPKLTQKEALSQLADLKEEKQDKAVNNESVTRYKKERNRYTIEPRDGDNDKDDNKKPTKATEKADKTEAPTETKAVTAPVEESETEEETEEIETDPPTEEPTDPPEDTGWKQAYIDWLNSSDAQYYDNCALVDVDGDGTPEIYCAGNFHMAGSMFIYYDGSSAQQERMGSGFAYSPGGGLIATGDMSMGMTSHAYYSYSSGVLTKIGSGHDNEGTLKTPYVYKWNDESVTKEEYEAKVNEYSGVNTVPDKSPKADVIAQIEAY